MNRFRCKSALLVSCVLMAMSLGAEPRRVPLSVNGRIPLGIESFRMEPSKTDFYLMASAENEHFTEVDRQIDGDKETLINRDGSLVKHYPERVQFRVSASSREKSFDDKPWAVDTKVAAEDFFAKLQFRVKVFHGLQSREVQPEYVRDIGMPRDVPYNERIYQIGFTIGKVPIEDRVVLEVISPTGERLCKFHLDLI